MKVGFIGVGQMGVHMAKHVIDAGFELVVNDARKEAAAQLLEHGAKWADSPAAVAQNCRVVISCLPSPASVEEVALGSSGLAQSLADGRHLHRHEHELAVRGEEHRRQGRARKACASSMRR